VGVVGQPVYYRHRRVVSEIGQRLVVADAGHHRVDVTGERAGGVRDRFAPTQLRVVRTEHDRVAAQSGHSGLERDPGAGARVLEQHGESVIVETAHRFAAAVGALQRRGAVENRVDIVDIVDIEHVVGRVVRVVGVGCRSHV
jgi:hypothetical protein